MKHWRNFRVTTNEGWRFNVTAYGNKEKFKSFCNRCKGCKVKCNQYIFLNCINTREDGLIVFRNMKEAREFMRDLLLF